MTNPPPDEQYERGPQSPGEFPQAPPPSPGEAQQPPRPKSVDTAFLLWIVAAALGVIGAVLGLAMQDAIMEETADQLGITVEEADAGAVGTIVNLLFIALWVGVAFAMRAGMNWARIVLTVLGGLSVLFGLFGLASLPILLAVGGLGVLQVFLNIGSLVVIIAAIVFMFRAEANHYFKYS